MEYRNLGRSGLKISTVSLGGWINFDTEDRTDDKLANAIIEAALDAGINFFDQADAYGRGESERRFGRMLAKRTRRHLVISSKLYWPFSDDVNDRGLSRKHIFESIEGSLERLGTSYLDLYFCHRFDPETPLLETAWAMHDLIRMGKILYWGTSEWPAEQVEAMCALCEARGLTPPIVEQPQYNLLVRQRVEETLLPVTLSRGMGLVTWSPLAMGMLTGKYDEGVPEGSRFDTQAWSADSYLNDESVERVKAMKEIADGLGITRAQLALAWLLHQRGVSSVITGATRVEHVTDNVRAAEVALDGATLARLDGLFALPVAESD
jgi:voltage-dependent potassium channel beta subunit